MTSILKPDADNAERCIARRQRLLKDGKTVFNQLGSVVDCTIRDFSETGAKLMCKDWRAVPAEFSLVTLTDGQIRDARVKWRHSSLIGIEFTSAPRSAAQVDLSVRSRRQFSRLLADQEAVCLVFGHRLRGCKANHAARAERQNDKRNENATQEFCVGLNRIAQFLPSVNATHARTPVNQTAALFVT